MSVADEPPRLNRADVDPNLERQLDSAASDEPVEAVLILQRDEAGAPCVAIPDSLLKRVCGNDPDAVLDSHYLPRLGVLIVRACPSIIWQLIAQPEVAIACANRIEDQQPAPALHPGTPARFAEHAVDVLGDTSQRRSV